MVRSASTLSLSIGTMMLATNTITARGQSPDVQKYTTPLMMVSSSEPSSDEVCMTGNKFAGIYSNAAAISSAHVRMRLSGLRECRREPHREQCCGVIERMRGSTRPLAWQATRPARLAVMYFLRGSPSMRRRRHAGACVGGLAAVYAGLRADLQRGRSGRAGNRADGECRAIGRSA